MMMTMSTPCHHTHTHIILHIHVENSLWPATMELYPQPKVDVVIAHKVIVAKIRALNDIYEAMGSTSE